MANSIYEINKEHVTDRAKSDTTIGSDADISSESSASSSERHCVGQRATAVQDLVDDCIQDALHRHAANAARNLVEDSALLTPIEKSRELCQSGARKSSFHMDAPKPYSAYPDQYSMFHAGYDFEDMAFDADWPNSTSVDPLTESMIHERLSDGVNVSLKCAKGVPMLGIDEMLEVNVTLGHQELKAHGTPDEDGTVYFRLHRCWTYVEDSCVEIEAVVVSKKCPTKKLREIGCALLDVDIIVEGFHGELSLVSEYGMLANSVIDIGLWPAKIPPPEGVEVAEVAEVQPASKRLSTVSPAPLTMIDLPPAEPDTPACVDIHVEISQGADFHSVAIMGEFVEIIVSMDNTTLTMPANPSLKGPSNFCFDFSQIVPFTGTSQIKLTAISKSYTYHNKIQSSVLGCGLIDAKTALTGFAGEISLQGSHGQIAGILSVAMWPFGTERPTTPAIVNVNLNNLIARSEHDVEEVVVRRRTYCPRIFKCFLGR